MLLPGTRVTKVLRMSRPLLVGSYLQVTWRALGQWKWIKKNYMEWYILLFPQDTAYHLRSCDCTLAGCHYRTGSCLSSKRRRFNIGQDNSSIHNCTTHNSSTHNCTPHNCTTHNSTLHMFCRYKTPTNRAPGRRWPLPARRGCIGRRSLLGDRTGYSAKKWDRRGFGGRSHVLHRGLQHAFRRDRRWRVYGCAQKEYEVRGGDRLSRRSAGKSQ